MKLLVCCLWSPYQHHIEARYFCFVSLGTHLNSRWLIGNQDLKKLHRAIKCLEKKWRVLMYHTVCLTQGYCLLHHVTSSLILCQTAINTHQFPGIMTGKWRAVPRSILPTNRLIYALLLFHKDVFLSVISSTLADLDGTNDWKQKMTGNIT